MLYLHGGLNSERDAAQRAVAFRDKFLANGIYPLHIMWETGPLETLASSLEDLFTDADERAGGLLEGMKNAKDLMLELTAAPIGAPMWSEMKENAWRASDHRRGLGAIQLMKKHALAALAKAGEAERRQWELHVVAHSAGSILFAHAVEHLCSLGIEFKTLQFFAPAVRIDEFRQYALPAIRAGRCPRATLYHLNEQQELDDTVGPYGRSLLWLVSNAFEGRRGTPLLGMRCKHHGYGRIGNRGAHPWRLRQRSLQHEFGPRSHPRQEADCAVREAGPGLRLVRRGGCPPCGPGAAQ
ncbi:MAG: hypothetical protein HYU75_21975, partial [Betaproteobacteria bacterium]|nr:hypothetical protein [Betaproteobacteria bacterium]